MTQTVTFTVTGAQTMHCAGCEHAIQRALGQLRGVRQVKADHTTQRVTVRLEPTQTNVRETIARLEMMGYQVVPVEA